ncbi:hypothetical protein KCV01_g1154, partial [Aureobasidium melanogenum]
MPVGRAHGVTTPVDNEVPGGAFDRSGGLVPAPRAGAMFPQAALQRDRAGARLLGALAGGAQTPPLAAQQFSGERRQGHHQHGEGQDDAHAEQRGQRADRGQFRAQVAADDIGKDHGLLDRARGMGGLDGQRPDQDGGHVVHHRGQHRAGQPRAQGRAPHPVGSEVVEQAGQVIGQPGIAQPVNDQIHAQRKQHDLPGRPTQNLHRGDLVTTGSHHQQHDGAGRGDGTDRDAQRLQAEEAHQQGGEHPPPRAEGGRVSDGVGRDLQPIERIGHRDRPPEVGQQDRQRRSDGDQRHRHHDGRVAPKPQVEEVRRDDVDQVGHDQGQAGGVGNEAGRHDEGEGRCWGKAEGYQHGHDDRREDQGRPVVGKDGRDRRAQEDQEGKEHPPTAAAPAGDMERRPLEEPRLIQQQADHDDRDERGRGVPDDVPDDRNVRQMNHAQAQGHGGSRQSTPADAQPSGLPDDEDQRGQEDQER